MSRGKFIAINAHMRSKERSKIDTLSSKLKELEEQDKQKNSKASRRQEITKIRAELKEIEIHTHKEPFKNSINPGAGFWKDQQNRQTTARLIKKNRGNNQTDAIKMIKGISSQIAQKCKPSSEITTNNCMHINQ